MSGKADKDKRLTWITMAPPKGWVPRPKWQRSAAIDQDGEVYIPAVIAGNEKTVFLCVAGDIEPVVIDSGHLFVRATWMAREFPAERAVCELILRRVAEVCGWPRA